MDNMVTSTRRLKPIYGRVYYVVNPTYTGSINPTLDEASAKLFSDQTTTSHRTGRGAPTGALQRDLDEAAEAHVTEARNSIDFARRLVDEARTDRRKRYDNGHPFFTAQRLSLVSHPLVDTNPGDIRVPASTGRYVGPLLIGNSSGGLPSWPAAASSPTSEAEVNSMGSRAISETIPTNSVAETSVALLELLQDGIPGLNFLNGIRRFSQIPSAAAGGYLGFLFGFLPAGKDLAELAYAVTESSRLLKQLERDSGKVVRRRRSYRPGTSSGSSVFSGTLHGGLQPTWFENAFSGGTNGSITVTDTTTIEWSFRGAYTYFLPKGNSLLDRIDRFVDQADYLLGLSLDIDAIWQAAPWSWLTDWFWNVGEVIHNITELSEDSQVLRYGYLMKTTSAERIYTHSPVTYKGSGASSGKIVNSYKYIRKERFRATPYGFGLDPSGFSERQKSILAALGVGLIPWF